MSSFKSLFIVAFLLLSVTDVFCGKYVVMYQERLFDSRERRFSYIYKIRVDEGCIYFLTYPQRAGAVFIPKEKCEGFYDE